MQKTRRRKSMKEIPENKRESNGGEETMIERKRIQKEKQIVYLRYNCDKIGEIKYLNKMTFLGSKRVKLKAKKCENKNGRNKSN